MHHDLVTHTRHGALNPVESVVPLCTLQRLDNGFTLIDEACLVFYWVLQVSQLQEVGAGKGRGEGEFSAPEVCRKCACCRTLTFASHS